jgi:CRISPR-associated protein Cas8b/Csh1 subtype I-B
VCDILPSRFNKILKVKNYIESKYHVITVKETKEGKKYHYNIRFAGIKDYFSTKVRTDLVYEPLFFKIIEAVFYKNPLDEKRILSAFMQKITTAFKQQNSFEFTDHVKHSFCIHQFFQTLQLFDKMEQNIDNQAVVCLNAKDFVAQHPLFFPEKAPLKKAAFYLGCATEVLLTAQRKRLGSEPFAKELNNLQFGYRELQVLYPKLLAKAKQYEEAGDIYTIYSDKNGVLIKSDLHDLTHAASECLTHDDAANGDKVEASFAFSLGLVMEKEFTRERVRVRMEEKERKEAAKKAV